MCIVFYVYIYISTGRWFQTCMFTFTSPFGGGQVSELLDSCLFQNQSLPESEALKRHVIYIQMGGKGGLVWGESAERCLTELLQAGSGWLNRLIRTLAIVLEHMLDIIAWCMVPNHSFEDLAVSLKAFGLWI